jgi:carboxyl-terminal processing protease
MRNVAVLFVLLALFISYTSSSQFPPGQQKAFLVKRMIELNHYSPRPVDDSFSLSLFRTMINSADPRRLLFTASDFKILSAYDRKLDDELKGSAFVFLDLFSNVYQRALIRADSIISAVMQKRLDFSTSESIVTSGRDTWNFAPTVNDLYGRWTRYFKLRVLSNVYEIVADDKAVFNNESIAKHETGIRDKIGLRERNFIKRLLQHPGGPGRLVSDMYLNAIAVSFDPHTNYFSAEDKEEFQSRLSTEGYSFGLKFDEDENGNFLISYLVPGGPAWKSGELNRGDKLQQLYWEDKEPADVSGLSAGEIEDIMELPSKERLVLKVKKADNTIKTVMLRKERINNPENIVRSFVLKGEKRIGYILLPGFYTQWDNETGSGCATDVAKEIIKLKKENIEGLILDVRFNGGGSMGEGLELTGIFVDEGPLAGHKDKAGKVIYYRDPNRGVIFEGPLILMVNGQSASASEMLAASLQDYNRAVIVGSTTYGKATVQQIFPLDSSFKAGGRMPSNASDFLKLTMAKFYRLDGHSTQLTGVKPDVFLPDAFEDLEIGERFEKNVLPSDTVKKNGYYKPLPALPLTELRKRSNERIKYDEDFKQLERFLSAQAEVRKATTAVIPLKWDEFERWIQNQGLASGRQGDNLNPGQKKFEPGNNQLDKQWLQNNPYENELNQEWLKKMEEDYYIREAFLVAIDLINLQKPLKN